MPSRAARPACENPCSVRNRRISRPMTGRVIYNLYHLALPDRAALTGLRPDTPNHPWLHCSNCQFSTHSTGDISMTDTPASPSETSRPSAPEPQFDDGIDHNHSWACSERGAPAR